VALPLVLSQPLSHEINDAFAYESWPLGPLGKRDAILTELVLHQGFTIIWDIRQET
jgi:hypothetical protein